MNLEDFKIKETFIYKDNNHLCCDIGSRSIICINFHQIFNYPENPEISSLSLVQDDSLNFTYKDYNEQLTAHLENNTKNFIPIIEAFKIYNKKYNSPHKYPYPKLLNIYRYLNDAIIVPYSAILEDNKWKICYFNHYTNEHLFASEEEILNMPILTREKKAELLEKFRTK